MMGELRPVRPNAEVWPCKGRVVPGAGCCASSESQVAQKIKDTQLVVIRILPPCFRSLFWMTWLGSVHLHTPHHLIRLQPAVVRP